MEVKSASLLMRAPCCLSAPPLFVIHSGVLRSTDLSPYALVVSVVVVGSDDELQGPSK